MERIAHRGAKLEFPENSLAAFIRAFERGANAIELDVHATQDDVIVVHHDDTAREAGGAAFTIRETPWAELSRIALADGATVPMLTDVIGAVPAGCTAYVEIKGVGIEELVAPVVARSTAACAVHSFDHECVRRMRQLVPNVPRGILVDSAAADLEQSIRAAGARDVWPEWTLVDRGLVGLVHSLGGRVIAWTVNDRDAAQRLVDMGVDGICSDDVRLLDAF